MLLFHSKLFNFQRVSTQKTWLNITSKKENMFHGFPWFIGFLPKQPFKQHPCSTFSIEPNPSPSPERPAIVEAAIPGPPRAPFRRPRAAARCVRGVGVYALRSRRPPSNAHPVRDILGKAMGKDGQILGKSCEHIGTWRFHQQNFVVNYMDLELMDDS